MPSLAENKQVWDGDYHWKDDGDEWSAEWGNSEMQWHGTILPRIHRFVPTKTILEVACGYGRWTQFLQKLCHKLIVVDISQACIEACQQRFADLPHLEYHLNDGKSLAAVADDSVDFVFSFDSLVHADASVLEAYIAQFPRILTKNGAVFIHHSNLGEYTFHHPIFQKFPILEKLFKQIYLREKNLHWRDRETSAKTIAELAKKYGLSCISQETVNWRTRRAQIDCFSVLVKNPDLSNKSHQVLRNTQFMQEVNNLARLSRLYT